MLTLSLSDAVDAGLRPCRSIDAPTYQGNSPTVSLYRAAKIVGVDRSTLLSAIRNKRLRPRPRDGTRTHGITLDALTAWYVRDYRFGPRLATDVDDGTDRFTARRVSTGKRWTADELVALVHAVPGQRSAIAIRVARCRARKKGIAC